MTFTDNRGYVKQVMVGLLGLVIARKALHLLKVNFFPLNQFIASALAATLCVSSMQAYAAVTLIQWGATARTDSAVCTGSLFGGCNIFDLTLEEGESVGGSQNSSASIGSASEGSTTGLQGRGSAGASVQIPTSGLSVPVLRAKAESTMDDFFVSGAALGVQAYQFTGVDGTPRQPGCKPGWFRHQSPRLLGPYWTGGERLDHECQYPVYLSGKSGVGIGSGGPDHRGQLFGRRRPLHRRNVLGCRLHRHRRHKPQHHQHGSR